MDVGTLPNHVNLFVVVLFSFSDYYHLLHESQHMNITFFQIGKLKNLCESFFKLKSMKPRLFLQEEVCICI